MQIRVQVAELREAVEAMDLRMETYAYLDTLRRKFAASSSYSLAEAAEDFQLELRLEGGITSQLRGPFQRAWVIELLDGQLDKLGTELGDDLLKVKKQLEAVQGLYDKAAAAAQA